ncbi:TPA: hypothetical protein N0F65_001126 [Lagenidium giganteum]|uniref:Uncharacterized protein n=1 Tax=Lagenidium giganteum TaxID=4803 RepID=A0AAV2YER4_9STRA|nr:TPA: hypothetical protein N0F65_001126 [Lagenidium giganteum]
MKLTPQRRRGRRPKLRIQTLVVTALLGITLGSAIADLGNGNNGTAAPLSTLAPTPTPSLSGCQICDKTGDCSHAYLGNPGQLCGHWLDTNSQRQSCCCPKDATCTSKTNYECKCSSTPAPTPAKTAAAPTLIGGIIGGIVFLALVGLSGYCIYRMCCRTARPPPPVKTGVPVVGAAVPAYNVAPQPMYTQPVYASPVQMAPAYGYGYGGSDTLGTVAAVAAGVVIADAIADAGDSGFHHHHGYDGGDYGGGYGGGFDGGGGGGFDGGGGGGDFGGDF